MITYTGETDGDTIAHANILAHGNNPASGLVTWTFTITLVASNSPGGGGFIVFKPGVSGTSITAYCGVAAEKLFNPLIGQPIKQETIVSILRQHVSGVEGALSIASHVVDLIEEQCGSKTSWSTYAELSILSVI